MNRVLLHGYKPSRRWALMIRPSAFFVGVRLEHREEDSTDMGNPESYVLTVNFLPMLSLWVQWYPERQERSTGYPDWRG